MKKRFLILLSMILALGSCTYFVVPPYTNVSKLSNIQSGMNIAKVNEILGIEAYDIYSKQDDGTTILVYNYRIKDRKVKLYGNDELHNEESQTDGKSWYTQTSKAYILFQDNKMKSLVTEKGREEAEYLLLTNNNMQLISKENLNTLTSNTESPSPILILNDKNKIENINLPTQTNNSKSIAIPLKNKTEKPNQIFNNNQENKKSKGTGWKITSILVPIIIIMSLLIK